jgi:hypothetical protein
MGWVDGILDARRDRTTLNGRLKLDRLDALFFQYFLYLCGPNFKFFIVPAINGNKNLGVLRQLAGGRLNQKM